MTISRNALLMGAIAIFAVLAPLVFPDYRTQIAMLWVMIIFAQTWDVMGGQMGYNSFGNIVFFGIGIYASAVVQRDWGLEYFVGLGAGMIVGAMLAVAAAAIMGFLILRMRGHYFAIATLGLGIAAGEIASGWEFVGAGSGMVTAALSRSHRWTEPLLRLSFLCPRRRHLPVPQMALWHPFRPDNQRHPRQRG